MIVWVKSTYLISILNLLPYAKFKTLSWQSVREMTCQRLQMLGVFIATQPTARQ